MRARGDGEVLTDGMEDQRIVAREDQCCQHRSCSKAAKQQPA